MQVLEIKNLKKRFGTKQVLRGVELTVKEHSIYGFIGRNGAGKTTTMKTVVGLLKPDQGEIFVCQEPVRYGNSSTNRQVGFLPDVPEYYGFMSPEEYLELCGKITGMDPRRIRERSQELLKTTGLWEDRKRRISGFSRGMKQRLGIAQALLHKPRLLICDEPTSALDPAGRKEILDILFQVGKEAAVLFSTHILADVERICDEIAVLDQGKIVLSGKLEDIRESYTPDCIKVEFHTPQDLQKFLGDAKNIQVRRTGVKEAEVTGKDGESRGQIQKRLYACLLEHPLEIQRIEVPEPSLENLFLEVIR